MTAKGSFWNSTAAMISAVGTLLAALVALAAFLVSQQFFTSTGEEGTEPLSPGSSQEQPPKLDGQVLWGPQPFLLDNYADLDGNGPNRDPETMTADIYMWSNDEMSAPYRMVKLTTGDGNQKNCASLLGTHGTPENWAFEAGERFCLKTNQGRIAYLVVRSKTPNGWEVEVTVWKQRL